MRVLIAVPYTEIGDGDFNANVVGSPNGTLTDMHRKDKLLLPKCRNR